MHEIPKEVIAQRDNFIARLEAANEVIAHREEAMNEKLAEVNEAIQTYNNILKEVDEMATKVVGDIESYIADKSEGWKEEKGDAYEEWASPWTCIDLSPLDLLDEPMIDDRGHAAALADLPLVPEC